MLERKSLKLNLKPGEVGMLCLCGWNEKLNGKEKKKIKINQFSVVKINFQPLLYTFILKVNLDPLRRSKETVIYYSQHRYRV